MMQRLKLLLSMIGSADARQPGGLTSSHTAPADEEATVRESQSRPTMVMAYREFSFRLYAEVVKHNRDKNIFISPVSVGMCLAMAYNGAAGDTRRAMAEALGIEGISLEEVNRAYEQLRQSLENPDPQVRFEVANSLWGRRGIAFNPGFINRIQQSYGGEVKELNFDIPGAPAAINSWVSRKTNGKIEKIVDSISRDAVLCLINAIYFKGIWAAKFDKAKTREDSFHLSNGSRKRVPMMSQSGEYQYFENDGFQAISLPYGEARISMYVFLPKKRAGLDKFHKDLTAANWRTWMRKFTRREGSLVLPRFKMEYEIGLNHALKPLGMGEAFSPDRADFSSMVRTTDNTFISEVKHKTYVDVNEEGTEAAAVTSVAFVGSSMIMVKPRPFRMVVDRPFFCAIRDNQTGTVLFMGSITEP